MAFAYNPFHANMDVLMEIDSAIRVGVSGDSVYLTKEKLSEYYDKIKDEINLASEVWLELDIQDFYAASDSYHDINVRLHELKKTIKNLKFKLAA